MRWAKEATVLTEDIHVAQFFEKALARHNNPKLIANWTINEVLREAKGEEFNELALDRRIWVNWWS